MSSTAEREGPTSHSGLSIVLPTFNEGGSIRQVIESLLHLGTDHPLEILIVDDAVSYTHLTLPTICSV